MTIIKPEYNGLKFRSRLVARWAVFFDACKVDWEYKPKVYLKNYGYYRPDFLLKNIIKQKYGQSGVIKEKFNLYAEVRRKMTEEDAEKIEIFRTNNYSNKNYFYDSDGRKIIDEIYYEIVNPVIILSTISYVNNIEDIFLDIDESFDDYELKPFKFYTFDDEELFNSYFEDWSAYPGINKDGQFTIFGDDDTFYIDEKATRQAYLTAKQARFENFL